MSLDLRALQASPARFRDALLIDADGEPRRFGPTLDPWQAKDFAALDAGWKRVAGQKADGPLRAYLERPRGHSKTSDLAVMATWALFASRRKLSGYGAAADLDQAKLLHGAIDRIVRLNPWLTAILEVQRSTIVNSRTGSTLEILTSDAPTSYGLTPDFLVIDELTHWTKRDLWDSLISSAAKRAACMLVIIANAGYGDSWQWETREAIRENPSWYFSRIDGPRASWITADRLEEQKRLLPRIAYERLWLNRWTSGSGDALDPRDIESALSLRGPSGDPEPGWMYFAGLDLGLSRDKAALAIVGRHLGHSEEVAKPTPSIPIAQKALIEAGLIEQPEQEAEYIVHPGTGRLRLAQLQVWTPPTHGKVDIEQIEETIVKLDSRFHLQIGADPWQAAYLIERLRKRNVLIVPVDFTGSNLKSMASSTLEAFRERNIELFPEPQLVGDLRALRVEERSYGFRLVSPRGPNGHGDSATALAIALHIGITRTGYRLAPHAQGTLTIY